MSESRVKLLPQSFIYCTRDDLIVLISRMLNSLIRINDDFNDPNISLTPDDLTRFHSRTPPAISVHNYLARLARYSSLENAVLLAAVYYIDLLSSVYKSFTLNSLTVHRFLLTATTVGSKGLCDSFCTNSHYAKVGGIHANELEILEREFLIKVNYRILPRDANIENATNDQKIVTSKRKNSIESLEAGLKIDQESDKSPAVKPKLGSQQNHSRQKEEAIEAQYPHHYQDQDQNQNQVQRQEQQQLNSYMNDIEQFKRLHGKQCSDYNVLDLYYKRMIALIGREVSSDDEELPQSFEYKLATEQKEILSLNNVKNLIKTAPDTLSDEIFFKKMTQLLLSQQQQQQQQQHNGTAFGADIIAHPAFAYIKENDTKNIPKSPLKRPNESEFESQQLPSVKKKQFE